MALGELSHDRLLLVPLEDVSFMFAISIKVSVIFVDSFYASLLSIILVQESRTHS